jgi:hypothetical protein
MTMRGLALAFGLAILLAAGPQSQKEGVAWATSWEDAKMEALERNVPILFTVQQDENPGSKQMENAFRDGSFISASRRFVPVVANPDTKHGQREVYINKQKTLFCRIYDGMSCDTHVRCQSALSNFTKKDFDIPMQVWCRPDGTEIFKTTRPQGAPQSASELIKDMERALERISGPSLSRKEWEDLKVLLQQGDEAANKTEFKVAMKCYKMVAESRFPKFAERGKQNQENLIRTCVNIVGRAIKQYEKSPKDSKESKEVKPMLVKISKEMKGTEAGDAADKALKDLNLK